MIDVNKKVKGKKWCVKGENVIGGNNTCEHPSQQVFLVFSVVDGANGPRLQHGFDIGVIPRRRGAFRLPVVLNGHLDPSRKQCRCRNEPTTENLPVPPADRHKRTHKCTKRRTAISDCNNNNKDRALLRRQVTLASDWSRATVREWSERAHPPSLTHARTHATWPTNSFPHTFTINIQPRSAPRTHGPTPARRKGLAFTFLRFRRDGNFFQADTSGLCCQRSPPFELWTVFFRMSFAFLLLFVLCSVYLSFIDSKLLLESVA